MKLFGHLCSLTWLIYGHQDICLWQQFLYGHQELSSPQNILAPGAVWGHNYLLSLELRRPLLLMWYLAAPCLCPIWTWQKSGRRRCLCRKLVPFHSLPSTNHGRFTCLPEVSAHLIVDQLVLRRSMLWLDFQLLHLEEAESIPGGPSDLLQNILHIFTLLGRLKVKKVFLKTIKLIKLPVSLLFWSFHYPQLN